MQQNLDDDAIALSDSAYLHWARGLGAQGAARSGGTLLQPAQVRLKMAEDCGATALSLLADAVLAGDLILDTGDLERLGLIARDGEAKPLSPDPDDLDDPFTAYWPQTDPAKAEACFAGMLEILQLARPISAPHRQVALQPEPDCPFQARSSSPLPFHPLPIVAVIDDGIGFLNTRFCRRDLRTTAPARYRSRFHAVWCQAFRTIADPVHGPAYVQAGQVLHRADIDALLAQGSRLDEAAAYRALNLQLLEPGAHRSTEFSFTHGTHILDLAAGADPEGSDPALDWPLLAVQLPPEAVDNTAGTQLEPCIVQAVRWILRQARRINDHSPVVINISFATFAGPKDGTKPIEALIAQAAERWQARTGRVVRVVYAFGNSRLAQQAARFDLVPGVVQQIDWRLQADDFAPSYLEFRPGNPADMARLQISLTPPGSGMPQVLGPIPANMQRAVVTPAGQVIGRFYHIGARQTAPGVISPAHGVLAMAPSAGEGPLVAPGGWTVALGALGSAVLVLRLEVQRGDTAHGYRLNGRQSYLDHPLAYGWEARTASYTAPLPGCPITREGTHSSFVTALSDCVFAVGAARADTLEPSPYSAVGAGWTRPTPTMAAAGDRGAATRGLVAAGTFSGSGRVLNGTSVAAAMASRVIATSLANHGAPPSPGAIEVSDLMQAYGQPGAPANVARQGAGVLTPLAEAVPVV